MKESANLILELSFENKSNFINKGNLYKKIKSYSELCYQILFYFVIDFCQFTEQQYYGYLKDENILIQDKYSNIDIDIFCLIILFDNSKGEYKLDEITSQWADFFAKKLMILENLKEIIVKYRKKLYLILMENNLDD